MQFNTVRERRHDVDWLRVSVFMLLIFYHIGQYYVADWEWHVKSEYQSSFLKNLMLLSNQWRMPLVFLVSGLSLALVEAKLSSWQLVKTRFMRLYLPIVIGMLIIVPPQLYYELIQKEGFSGTYGDFYSIYLNINTIHFVDYQTPMGILTWNHLWYLAYLWHYTLLYILIKPLIKGVPWNELLRRVNPCILIFAPLVLCTLYGVLLKPYYPQTNQLFGDWYNHALYLTTFFMGYVLAKSPNIWDNIIRHRRMWLVMACVSFVVFLLRFHGYLPQYDTSISEFDSTINTWIKETVVYINMFCWVYAAIGYAGLLKSKQHPVLSYMNDAILPWYIVHQTIIIVFAANIANYHLGPVVEPIVMIIATLLGCFLFYEIVRRFYLFSVMFGVKR